MQFKIFTRVITLEFTNSETIIINKQGEDILMEMESEITMFISNKPEAKVKFYQSSSNVIELLMQSKAIPFTQFTTIVYW